jgi:hypothetical protein
LIEFFDRFNYVPHRRRFTFPPFKGFLKCFFPRDAYGELGCGKREGGKVKEMTAQI